MKFYVIKSHKHKVLKMKNEKVSTKNCKIVRFKFKKVLKSLHIFKNVQKR